MPLKLITSKKLLILIGGSILSVVFIVIGITYYSYGKLSSNALTVGHSCGAVQMTISMADENGFIYYHRPIANLPSFIEFVLKPNSTGYLTMVYDFSSYGSGDIFPVNLLEGKGTIQNTLANTLHENEQEFINHTLSVYKLKDNFDVNGNPYTQHIFTARPNPDYHGLIIYPSKVVNVTDSLLSVTYAIKASEHAEKGSYLVGLGICPGELVTIGESPRQGPLPYNNSTIFYGQG